MDCPENDISALILKMSERLKYGGFNIFGFSLTW